MPIATNTHTLDLHCRCQFHQCFYVQIFRMKVVWAAFSSYILALAKNLYEKCAQKMLMKLMAGQPYVKKEVM